MRNLLLAAGVMLALAGCQSGGIPSNAQWVNIKDANADHKRDGDACEREAVQAIPASVKSTGGSEMQSSCTGAGYTTACTSSAGMVHVDQNTGQRVAYAHTCMRTKGWRPMVNGVDVDPDK